MRNLIPTDCLPLCPEGLCDSPADQGNSECADCAACIMPCGDSCASDQLCDDVTDPTSPVCVADPCVGACTFDEHCDVTIPASPVCVAAPCGGSCKPYEHCDVTDPIAPVCLAN